MKFFTQDWASGVLSDEDTEQVRSSYWQHVDSIVPKLTAPIIELAKQINIHDGLIRYVIVDRQAEKLTLALRCGDLQTGYYDLDLSYSSVEFNLDDIVTLSSVSRYRKTELLYDEVDINEQKKFIHRILVYPKNEISIVFTGLEITKEDRPDRHFSYEGDPFCTAAGTHPDGSICLEGKKIVPNSYVPCCEVFSGHTNACIEDIRYEWWSKKGQWVIAISEYSGGGGIVISYCPHCGQKLED